MSSGVATFFIFDIIAVETIMSATITMKLDKTLSSFQTIAYQTMVIQRKICSKRIFGNQKKNGIWHKRLGYASHAKVICTSKLMVKMSTFSTKYNPSKVYNNFNLSNLESNITTTRDSSLMLESIDA